MTDERAIEILCPEHREHYESIEPVNEACRIGMEAIRKVKELRAENAALRERLGKAVELPCKVGDKVYIPWVWDNQSGIMEAPVITIRLYPYIRKYEIRLETDSLNFAQKYHYGNFNDKDFGTLIFTTREAAEARLKDLQGGKQ